jgi:hypothetical protein
MGSEPLASIAKTAAERGLFLRYQAPSQGVRIFRIIEIAQLFA